VAVGNLPTVSSMNLYHRFIVIRSIQFAIQRNSCFSIIFIRQEFPRKGGLLQKLCRKVVMTVAGVANCKIDYNAWIGKGEDAMYTIFEETKKEGKIEGEAKGIIEAGFDFGLSENDILERLQNKLKVSLKKAQEYLEMFGKHTVY